MDVFEQPFVIKEDGFMKWYCNKKYIPQTGSEMLIRTICIEEYERYFIATLELHDGRELLVNWDMANGAHHDLKLEKYTVTHFCTLDPVEIEECGLE